MSKIRKIFEVVNSEKSYVLNYNALESSLEAKITEKTKREDANKEADAGEELIRKKEAEAQRIIESAKASAEEIVYSAKLEAERIYNEARASAFNQGYAEGISAAKEEYCDRILQVEKVLGELQQLKQNMLSELEPQLVDLCMAIVQKILTDKAMLDNSLFLPLIANAIKKVSQADKITVHLSPEQFDSVAGLKNAIKPYVKRLKSVEFKLDEFLKFGDCVVETECGTIDAGINTQMRRIKEAFSMGV